MGKKRGKKIAYKKVGKRYNFTDGFVNEKSVKEFQRQVYKSNNKREKMLTKLYNEVKNTPNMVGISREAYGKILEKKGFINKKLSGAMKQFKSKEEFNLQNKDVKTINKPYYNQNKIGTLRNRMLRQINYNTGHFGKELRDFIKGLSDSELISLYVNGSEDFLQEIFDSDSVGDNDEDRASALRGQFNIKARNLLSKKERNKFEKDKKNNYIDTVDYFNRRE